MSQISQSLNSLQPCKLELFESWHGVENQPDPKDAVFLGAMAGDAFRLKNSALGQGASLPEAACMSVLRLGAGVLPAAGVESNAFSFFSLLSVVEGEQEMEGMTYEAMFNIQSQAAPCSSEAASMSGKFPGK